MQLDCLPRARRERGALRAHQRGPERDQRGRQPERDRRGRQPERETAEKAETASLLSSVRRSRCEPRERSVRIANPQNLRVSRGAFRALGRFECLAILEILAILAALWEPSWRSPRSV